jgi:crotonobetainyl-CoA:carnitine CoA-transferase CaiB-like acyl-CoA transferase
MRPGIIVVSTSSYGHAGTWHFRPGFEQLAQSCTGMAIAQGSIDSPQLAPTFPNDYLTGFLGALGTLAALLRRAQEGGSYHVRVSLARSGTWLQSLGKVDRDALPPEALPASYISGLLRKEVGPLGELTYFGPSLRLSETPPRWERTAQPLGAHFPVWADQQAKALEASFNS